jgi:hypothetical protein
VTPLLALLLTLAPAQAEDERPGPDPREIASTVQAVETALREGEKDEKLTALREASSVPAGEVATAVARGFRDRDPEVVDATVQSLRFLAHPDALEELHRAYRARRRALRKDVERRAAFVKAIGQHGDVRSIPILADDPFETEEYELVRAHILGLGRIRDRAALEALFGVMKGERQRRVDRHMGDLRLSLVILTGTDQGPSAQRWHEWWSRARRTFEIAPERPAIPRNLAERWVGYWGLERDYGRTQRREDRGDDPERRGG